MTSEKMDRLLLLGLAVLGSLVFLVVASLFRGSSQVVIPLACISVAAALFVLAVFIALWPLLGGLQTAKREDGAPIKVAACLVIFIVLGMLAVGFHSSPAKPTAFLWACACFAAGGTLGFLFGIPRTLQGEQPAGSSAPSLEAGAKPPDARLGYTQRVNTNLEQISDWLTKILVGLGLTQLDRVSLKLQEASSYIASGMGGSEDQKVFAYAMIIYFSVVGFIGGYLFTRLFLARAFRVADIDTKLEETVQKVQVHSDLNRFIVSALQDLARDNTPPSTMEEDLRELEKVRSNYPLHRTLHIVLGRLHEKLGNRDQAIALLSEFIEAKQRAGQAQDKDVADALFNRACYYSLKSAQVEGPHRERLELAALEDLKTSVSLSPSNARDADADEDLRPLRPLPGFKELVGN